MLGNAKVARARSGSQRASHPTARNARLRISAPRLVALRVRQAVQHSGLTVSGPVPARGDSLPNCPTIISSGELGNDQDDELPGESRFIPHTAWCDHSAPRIAVGARSSRLGVPSTGPEFTPSCHRMRSTAVPTCAASVQPSRAILEAAAAVASRSVSFAKSSMNADSGSPKRSLSHTS